MASMKDPPVATVTRVETPGERMLRIEKEVAAELKERVPVRGSLSSGKISWSVTLPGLDGPTYTYRTTRSDIDTPAVLEMVSRLRRGEPVENYNPDGNVKVLRDGSVGVVDRFRKTFGRGRVEEEEPKRPEYNDDLLEEAAKYVDANEIKAGGGHRQDENKAIYWLPLPELVEFEKADEEITNNTDFWDWFRAFRKKHDFKRKRKRVDWDDRGSYQTTSWGYRKVSSWWSDWGYSGGSIGTELERDLMIALGAISTTVGVINNTGKRFRVRLASNDTPTAPSSMTVFDEQLVLVSPQALLDQSIDKDMRIEVSTGWGLHEASHIRDTWPLLNALNEPTQLRPRSIAAMILNILEDTRIERNTSELYPGFAGFFDTANTYLWDITKHLAPTIWGPELGDKINAITASIKWPKQYEVIAKHQDAAGLLQEPRLAEEFDWFNGLRDRYLALGDARGALLEALMHLAEDEETKQQLEKQAGIEKAYEDAEGKSGRPLTEKEFRDLIRDLKELLQGGKDLMEPCPSPNALGGHETPVLLTPEQASTIDRLIGTELKEHKAFVQMHDGFNVPEIWTMKPELDDLARRSYERPGALVQRLKAAFFFRKAAPQYSTRLLRSGMLDEEELPRVLGYDYRVFERKVVEDVPDTQVTMLVDLSGSMKEAKATKLKIAQELANTMLECLRTMPGVRVRVRGHTTESKSARAAIYRLWEPGDPVERLGLISTIHNGWNYDGFAIDFCAQELVADWRPGEDMVLIVVSDGKPNGNATNYSGPSAMRHVREVVKTFERRGVTTIQIAIDPELRTYDQAAMYDNWIQYESNEKLPMQLTHLLIKLFGG